MQPDRPVVLRAATGGQATDYLWSRYVGYACISKRVFELLTTRGFTGWGTYPVQVYGRRGEVIADYFGFAVTGPTIPWDRSRSEVITAKPARRKGLYFDESLWDGSDFFRIEYFEVVTSKVRQAFKKAKVTNVRLTPIGEVDELLLMDKYREGRAETVK